VPGVGHRSRRTDGATAGGAVGRRPDSEPSDPGDGARDAGPGLSRVRLLQPGSPRDPRPGGRGGRALPRHGVQWLGLQDRAPRSGCAWPS
jgi:hypothetical protein